MYFEQYFGINDAEASIIVFEARFSSRSYQPRKSYLWLFCLERFHGLHFAFTVVRLKYHDYSNAVLLDEEMRGDYLSCCVVRFAEGGHSFHLGNANSDGKPGKYSSLLYIHRETVEITQPCGSLLLISVM